MSTAAGAREARPASSTLEAASAPPATYCSLSRCGNLDASAGLGVKSSRLLETGCDPMEALFPLSVVVVARMSQALAVVVAG